MSKTLIFVVWCVFYSFISSAQSQDSLQNILSLKEVVVSASKIPLERKETAKQVLTITADQISKSEGKDLAQLLNEHSGIIVNGAYSNPGKNRDVFIRGASSEYTLILVDGIPISDAAGLGGAFDLRLLPLHQVEKIEILKGSQSTLYGSDAIAGVINIVTKSPGNDAFSLYGSLSTGSLNTTKSSLGVTGKRGIIGYNVGYSRLFTEGLSEAKDNVDTLDFDKDGSLRNAIQANLEITPVNSFKISPFILYTDFDGNFDAGAFSDAPNTFNSEVFNPGARISYSPGRLGITGLYNFIQTDRTFNSTFGESIFEGRIHNYDLFANYELNENFQLIGGIYAQHAKILDDQGIEEDPYFAITSPYISFLATGLQNFNAELSYRLNSHSEFGNHSTYSTALSYDLSSNITAFSSYTTGFKSPNLNQLFGSFGPNPDLKPQISASYEVGTQFNFLDRKLTGQFVYFDRSIEDVITFDFTNGYQNQNEQNDQGLEAELTYQLSNKWSVMAHYNYVDGEVTAPLTAERDTTFFNLIRRPKHSFVITLNAEPSENFFISLQGQYYGVRTDSFFNSNTFQSEAVKLDPYFLVNAYLEYKAVNDQLIFFADLKNITDTDFTESTGFSTIGFNLQTGVRFRL